MKVAIMGAGISGLVMALACIKQGMEVTLYEKSSSIQHIGGGIIIYPHGIRYLQKLGVYEGLDQYHISVENIHIHNANGRTVMHDSYAALYHCLNGKILPIERSHLQQVLLDQLPQNILKLNKHCITLDETENGVVISFSDGTKDFADCVIGADGLHSKVRACLVKEEVLNESDYQWWGGLLAQDTFLHYPQNTMFFGMEYGKTCVVWPLANGQHMWFIPAKNCSIPVQETALLLNPWARSTHLNTATTNSSASYGLLKTLSRHWKDDVVQHIITLGENERAFHYPIHTVSPRANWSGKRITLIGDAAHAMGPLLGQGASLGIEDAYVLASVLKNRTNDIPELIRQYERVRYERVLPFIELENKSASILLNNDRSSMDSFQQQLTELTLVSFYKELIPLIDEEATSEDKLIHQVTDSYETLQISF